MIKNLKEHIFRWEEIMNDMIDFVKEERLRRTKKEKKKNKVISSLFIIKIVYYI